MSVQRKRSKTVHNETREVIRNLLGICEDEKLGGELIVILNRVINKAALYSSLSISTVVSKKKNLIILILFT